MPGEVEPPDRKRALLLLSLILLVINSAATVSFLRRSGAQSSPARAAFAPVEAEGGSVPGPGAIQPSVSARPTAKQAFLLGKRIDINKASWQEISELPGISDPVARAVVEARGRLGGFRAPEDLLSVRGIKEKRLKKILPFLVKLGNK